MQNSLRVAVVGTGQMGSGIIRLLLQKKGIELVGVCARRAERAGIDVGKIAGVNEEIGITVGNDLPDLLQRTTPDLVLHATCSRVADGVGEILTSVRHHAHVITIAEEMAYPTCQAAELAAQIHASAVANGVTVLGTGINPGFVLDDLVIALTGVCWRVDSITARRINDLSPYGPSVLTSQGVGITPEAFHRGLAEGSIVGHFGFPESISMIANALGWKIDAIEQRREPIVSRVRRETPFVCVEPGQTAGCKHTAVAYRAGKPVIQLIHPQQVHPHLENIETGDSIEIRGEPNVNFVGSPEIPGGIGTIALAVNMIPHVINSPPGLKTMAELPAPAAMMGDVRLFIKEKPPR